ncbi:dUTPase [Armadillidium vulgare iridescent virus]|uniref:dUTP diphosphatase n=1 Tax=Armadillidium vulgare iridescent virus TaxID=72201 RepID=A0A068QKF6_9VIRU|nr:dUTPase [Armadillidium vulgare iridescent virus]CCV02512.1 putative dUTP pyrophosphatase [Armadillidium vulgare iridescent virus]
MDNKKLTLNALKTEFELKFKSMEAFQTQLFEKIERLEQQNAKYKKENFAQQLDILTVKIEKNSRISEKEKEKEKGGTEKLKYAFLSENARDPVRIDPFDAGIDLKSAYDFSVPARGRELIKTDLQFEFPQGYFGKIESRSGLSWKKGIETGAGIIDFSYRGPLGVVLHNHTDEVFYIKAGDRIAQMILEEYGTHELVKCPPLGSGEEGEISSTERGDNGFGSSGI